MKKVVVAIGLVFTLIMFVGCSNKAEALSIGEDTYMVSADSDESPGLALESAVKIASEKCEDLDKVMKLESKEVIEGDDTWSAAIKFYCLDAEDKDYKRD